LDISNNRIGAFGAVALGKALAVNNSLKSLNLRLNTEVGDEGASLMLEALYQDNYSLHDLTLAGCQVGVQTANKVMEAIKRYGVINAKLLYEKENPGSWKAAAGGLDDSNSANPNASNENRDPESTIEEEEEEEAAAASTATGKAGGKGAKPMSGKHGVKQPSGRGRSNTETKKNASTAANRKGLKSPGARRRTSTMPGNAKGKSGKRSGLSTPDQHAREEASANVADSDTESILEQGNGKARDDAKLKHTPLRLDQIAYPAGMMHLDLSSNPLITDEPCGKWLFDAVKVNKWILKLDIRGTEIAEHYSKAIIAVVASNKDHADPSWTK
jgi:hypothetical protein